MDWKLVEHAREAEDGAAGLHLFLDEVPHYGKDITGNIAELFAISNALYVLDEGLHADRHGSFVDRILPHLDIVLASLTRTLASLRRMLGQSKRSSRQHPGAFPGTPHYATIWDDACSSLEDEGISLSERLRVYRSCLQDLYEKLKGDPVTDDDLDESCASLAQLLKRQRHVGSRTPGPVPPRSATPSTSRPPPGRFQTYPPYSPASGSPMFDDRMPSVPPPVPDIPHSPTYSATSSQTYSTFSTESSTSPVHWAAKVFDGRHSSSSFQTLGQVSRCFGRDEPNVIELLDSDGFIKVLELPFEATNVWVRLYLRLSDHRARVLVLALDSAGRRVRFCIPLTALKVLRTGSCLQLCRVNRTDGKLDLWANLRFTLYERMVLFYCTVVAMKRQDQMPTPNRLEDLFQPGEKEEFGGEIQDDHNYLHAFRIFRDRDSGCVRFETAARRGAMKTIPIWTAFVTEYIGQWSWMKRIGTTTVQLRELHPYVFCDGYTVPRGPSGRYQLTFTSANDTRGFVSTFHSIREP